jgi:hypothetical protein
MPPFGRNNKFSKEAQKNSAFGKAISAGLSDANKKLMNAIEFIEGPTGIGVVLRPVQRVITKCLFGVPLDFRPAWANRIPLWGQVEMWDVYREHLTRTVTEEEYLHIAFNEGRCNVGDWRDIPNLDKPNASYNEACIFAGRRGGKLLDVDEPIPSPNGIVRNGDLKDGDQIFGETGQVHSVIKAHPIVKEEAYRVSFDDGTSVLAHGGHLWLTYDRSERRKTVRRPKAMAAAAGSCGCGCGLHAPIAQRNHLDRGINRGEPMPFRHGHHPPQPVTGTIRTTKEIMTTLKVAPGGHIQANHAVQLPKPIELPERELPLDPYTLGAWLGDGSRNSGGLTGVDQEIWKEIERAGFQVSHSPNCTTSHYIRNLVPILQTIGVLSAKHIPHDYLWSSKEQRLALLQGLMDTDGSCMTDGQCEFSNTNKNLSEGVYHLVASLGLKPFWSEKIPVCANAKGGAKRCKKAYMVRWTGTLPVFRLTRKIARLPKKIKDTQNWRYITSVEPVGKRQMRCITTDNSTGLYLFGKNFNITHNSQLVSAITCYKLYLLLNIRSPQEYFGLVPGSPIDITYLAQDEKGADRLFRKLSEDVNRSTFFEPFLKDNNKKALTFVCEADRNKRDITPTLTVWSLSCTTNAVRGPSSVFLALDEFAHFRSEKGSTSEDMYASATPATGDFHHTEREYEDGTTEVMAPVQFTDALPEVEENDLDDRALEQPEDISRKVYDEVAVPAKKFTSAEVLDSMIFSISSPLKRVGKMYELHKLALEEGPQCSIFTLNCSTAEMNNKLPTKFLQSEFKKSTATFRAEYGGQFLESSESYVTEAAVKICVDCQWDDKGLPVEGTARQNLTAFHPMGLGRQYFWGFDLGMTNDASALAIAHLEYGGGTGIRLIYDYIDRMMVREHFTGPGVSSVPGEKKYEGFTVLPLEDILLWLKMLNRIMPCFRGATDQHGGQQLVQLLELNGVFNMQLLNLTPAINSQMAYALRGYIENKLCSFPYVPKFISELRLVELEVTSKYRIRVRAPLEKNAHDDMADSAQLCAFLAQKWLIEEGNLHLDPKGVSLLQQQQAAKHPLAIGNIEGVPLSTLRIMEKVKKVSTNLGYSSGVAPHSPFSRRGRRR